MSPTAKGIAIAALSGGIALVTREFGWGLIALGSLIILIQGPVAITRWIFKGQI